MDELVTVVRHRSELGAWEMATRQAHPALRGHVVGYYGSRGYTARDPEGNLWSFGTYQPAAPTP